MNSKKFLIKNPSAWTPIFLSLSVFTVMFITIAMNGAPRRETDEGTSAHLFQIWLVAEVCMVTFFAIKYLPKNPKQALLVLALQVVAIIAACAPVFILKL